MAKKTKTKIKSSQQGKGKKKKSRLKKKRNKQQSKYAPMELDAVYAVMNQAQIKKVEQYLFIAKIDGPMIENILKDCKMSFTKMEKIDAFHYVIQPPPEEKTSEEDFDFDDEFEDEIKDDEQCF